MQPLGDEVPVALHQPEHEQARVADVVHRLGERHLRRASRPAPWRCARACAARRGSPPAPAGRRSAPPGRRADHEAAEQRRGDVVGVPLEPGRGRRAGRRRARRSSRPPSARPRRRPRSSPGRPTAARRERIVNSKSSAGCSVSNARTARLRRSRAIARSVWTAKRPVSSTSSSTCSPSAAASTSKPGPRLADDAGTRTRRRRFISYRRSRARRRRCPARRARPSPAWASAVCGSLSPWPVSTQAIRSAPSAPLASRPATPGRRGRLAEHALLAGEEAVGVEDLLVGDGAHRAARAREGVERLLPAGGVADPDRARDGLGRLDRRAVHQRRGARGLEAEHPRRASRAP